MNTNVDGLVAVELMKLDKSTVRKDTFLSLF